MARDNMQWPDPNDRTMSRPGSGAIALFSVPLASLTAAGCTQACWAQGVTTTIELYEVARGQWRTIAESDWHNDNLNADPGANNEPWYCYEASFITNGTMRLGDGPHLVHTNEYCFNGRKYRLNDGDLIRRRSAFVTCLICYDPSPEQLLAAYTWSVTTIYTYNSTNQAAGGSTVVTQPVYINLNPGSRLARDVVDPSFRKVFDRDRLKDHLKKKRKDQERCR